MGRHYPADAGVNQVSYVDNPANFDWVFTWDIQSFEPDASGDRLVKDVRRGS